MIGQGSGKGGDLREIAIWPDAALNQPFAEPSMSSLETPNKVAETLEANWEILRDEIDSIPDAMWTDPYPFLNPKEGGWGVYVLYHNRTWDEQRCLHTPKACALAKTLLPATKLPYFHPYNEEAGFFRMAPGAVIAPHSGPVNSILNTHVGLRGVEGARFFVNGTEVKWEEGKTFSFEDSFEHWGWHEGNEMRVIFMIRQMHPDVTERHYHGHRFTQAGATPSALAGPRDMSRTGHGSRHKKDAQQS